MAAVAAELLEDNSEWVSADALNDDVVRQGDCLLLRNTSDDVGPVSHGLVITADCDIAQRKTSGCVSYVPILPIKDYIFRFWIPEHIEAKGHGARCLEPARKLILERAKELMPDAKPLSDSALFRVAEDGLKSVFPNEDKNPKRAGKLTSYILGVGSLDFLRRRDAGRSMAELRRHAVQFLRACELGTLERLLERAGDSLREAVTGAGTLDIYPLGHLSIFDVRPQIAMLRFVRSVPEESVTTSLADFRFGKKQACRVARLRHEVKYDCMQRFGRLFVRSGKPDPINNACKDKLQSAIGSIGKEEL